MFNCTYFSFLFCYSLLCLRLRGDDQFHVVGPYLNLLEPSENQKISDVFMGCRKRPLAWNGLILYKINCMNEVSLPCFTVIQNSETFSGSILGPTLFLIYINNISDDVICNITTYDYNDDANLYLLCDQTSDLWQQTGIGFWTWIWSSRLCGLKQELACSFQCWKNSIGFVWLI